MPIARAIGLSLPRVPACASVLVTARSLSLCSSLFMGNQPDRHVPHHQRVRQSTRSIRTCSIQLQDRTGFLALLLCAASEHVTAGRGLWIDRQVDVGSPLSPPLLGRLSVFVEMMEQDPDDGMCVCLGMDGLVPVGDVLCVPVSNKRFSSCHGFGSDVHHAGSDGIMGNLVVYSLKP